MSDLKISITLDAAQLKRELGLTQDELKKIDGKQISVKTDAAQSGIAKLRDSIAMWGLAINGAITAAKSLAGAINSVVAPAMLQEKAERDLAAALKNTGVYSAQLEAHLKAQASAIQNVTTYGDESIMMATRQMQVIGQLSADQLPAAQKAAVGLASAYKLDLNTAFEMVGKAAAGNTATLSRYGIVLDEGLGSQEKFNELLRIGSERFSIAQNEAGNAAGILEQLNNTLGDAKEILGRELLPIITTVAAGVGDLIKAVFGMGNAVKDAQREAIMLKSNFEFLTGTLLKYKEATSLTNTEQEDMKRLIAEINQAYPDYFENIDLHTSSYQDLAEAVRVANQELDRQLDIMIQQKVLDQYSDEIVKKGEKRLRIMREIKEWEDKLAAGQTVIPVGRGNVKMVQDEIDLLSDWVSQLKDEEEQLRTEMRELQSVLRTETESSSADEDPAKPKKTGLGKAAGSVAASAAQAEVTETAKAYATLLDNLRKYHSDAAIEKLDAHQKAMAQINMQFEDEQRIILASMQAKEISTEEGEARLLEIRGKYEAQIVQERKKADDEIIALAQKRIDQAVQDDKSYYETMKFADSDYYEWKKAQIRAEVEAMAIDDAAKMALIKQHLAELDALKAEYNAVAPEKKGNWFFHGLLGFDPGNDEDLAKIQAVQDTYRNLASGASNITNGLMRLSSQRKAQELADIDEIAAKNSWSNEKLLAEKAEINKKFEAEERKLKRVQRTMSIAQATINTAEGVTKALTLGPILGPIMAAVITAMGAAQIGIISAQKFAAGGMVSGPGGPRDDKIPAMLSNGEYVVNAGATKRFQPILDAINFGKSVVPVPRLAYADGGMVMGGSGTDGLLKQLIEKVEILNMNLVRKDLSVTVKTNGVSTPIRDLDATKRRMEERGYDPVFAQ